MKDGLVTCEIYGPGPANCGLGNQLFCISNVIAYSIENNKTIYLPQIRDDDCCKKYSFFYENIPYFKHKNLNFNTYYELEYSYNRVPRFDGNVKLVGYFQSYKYFEKYKKEIFDIFQISANKKNIIKKYGDISNATSIHVRRGDYLKLQNHHTLLSIDYYKESISYINNKDFIIFSDDIDWCKENFGFLKNIKYIKTDYDYEDMMCMSLCKNNIISNSTFSWWGAYFNENNGITIAPKNWFGPLNNKHKINDLFLDNWKVI